MEGSGDVINISEEKNENVLDHKDEEVLLALDESEEQENAGGDNANGVDEQENLNMYKDEENGDKEDNEFVVWADDAEEMEEDKKRAQEAVEEAGETAKVKKEFGIEMSKDTDELLVTWNNKEIKVPCKEEVSRDLRYYSRLLHLVAYPICLADLDDPCLKSCLRKATNVAMEIQEANDGPPDKGYLRVKFNSVVQVKEVRAALEALPPFPKNDAPTTEAETTVVEAVTTAGDEAGVEKVEEKEGKDEEKEGKVDEPVEKMEEGDEAVKVDEKSGGVEGAEKGGEEGGEEGGQDKGEAAGTDDGGDSGAVDSGVVDGGVEKDVNKRNITILLLSDNVHESQIMSKIKASTPSKDPMVSRLLYVANIAEEITEPELSGHFTGCERVIIPTRDNKAKGYAYVQYSSQAEAKEALCTFRQTAAETGWFVIEAINQRKAEIGLLKDELRSYWLDQIRNLEGIDQSSKNGKELSDLEQKLMRYKRRIIIDNTKRQELGFVITEAELYTLPGTALKEDVEGAKAGRERSRERSRDHHRSGSKRRSRSRRRRSPPKFSRRFERGRPGARPGGSSFGSSLVGGRRTMQASAANEGGLLVNQLQQLVGALSNNMSHQMAQNINRNFSNQSNYNTNNNLNNNNFNNPTQFNNNNYNNNRSNFSDDRSRYGVTNQRGRFDHHDSDRKRRYDDGDRHNGRYNQDYRGFRGNGY